MSESKQGPASAAPAAEPLSAILADYRADIPSMTSGELPHPTPEYLRILLDRIEAAAAREREVNQKILAAANDANAILKDDRDRAIRFANAAPHPGSVSWKEMHEVYTKARAILSAVPKEGPARNCDRFKNAEEAEEAFVKFCGFAMNGKIPYWKCPPNCGHTGPDGWVTCCIRWLFAPAKEGGDHA